MEIGTTGAPASTAAWNTAGRKRPARRRRTSYPPGRPRPTARPAAPRRPRPPSRAASWAATGPRRSTRPARPARPPRARRRTSRLATSRTGVDREQRDHVQPGDVVGHEQAARPRRRAAPHQLDPQGREHAAGHGPRGARAAQQRHQDQRPLSSTPTSASHPQHRRCGSAQTAGPHRGGSAARTPDGRLPASSGRPQEVAAVARVHPVHGEQHVEVGAVEVRVVGGLAAHPAAEPQIALEQRRQRCVLGSPTSVVVVGEPVAARLHPQRGR